MKALLAERIRAHRDLFKQVAEAMTLWEHAMLESKTYLTPTRLDNMFDILHLAQNKEPEPK